ncbi:poly-gamma-glutamate synthase PgsB [bacterium]|nr:poly-gamma-glutamate synthase PgsB [bacterium]
MLILFLILIAMCSYGAWEYVGHQRRLKRIPIRIHVNGSRGKSSVTRLIAAGLRAGGIRTVGKTTGTLPRILDPDGNDIAIKRHQQANIIEQVKMLSYIERYKPEALITECMAVLPEYQWICEKQMVRSTIGVITNCRLDHTNEMGKFREQISLSLANTCPRNGVLFTSEKTNLDVLKKVADREHTEIQRIGGQDVSIDELRRFGHIEHRANVGLSLAICKWAGVDRETALEGMYKSVPDAGALRVAVCQEGDTELLFVNALAANDPESTLEIWRLIRERFSPLGKVIFLLNSRTDRQDRSVQLIEMVAGNIEFDYFVLTGEKTRKFMGDLLRNNVPKEKSISIGWIRPEKTYHRLFELVDVKGTILAMGNVGAGGLDLFRYFYKKRIFPIGVNCPHCNRSLMDPSYLIDSFPAIHVDVEMEDKRGWLRLSTMYGSYKIGSAFDIPHDSIVRMFCTHCETELVSRKKCPDCGIIMISMAAPNGGTAHICPRRGCKGHILETANQET